MTRHHPTVISALCAATLLLLTGCQSGGAQADAEPEPLTLATTPLGDDPTQANPVVEIAALLEAETGRKVEIRDVPDYLSVVEAIRSDHVDFGIMSGFPSALAVNTGEVDALIAWEGDDTPVSTCAVLEDSPVRDVQDLRGGTLAFADQASSSGFFMPVYMLHEAGLERGTDYEAIFAGGHEGSFAALEKGQVDAACTAVMLTKLDPPMFPFAEGQWRGIGESPSMPITGAVLARQSLDPETRELLQNALATVMSEENADALGPLASISEGVAVIDPTGEHFRSFIDIAAVAGVDLSDLK
ncbi:MAG: phosphate/phosphite/phosphonate ABC transporter substrate-binding protein [Dietzia sp.]